MSNKHRENERLPISYIIRSTNKLESSTDTNKYTVFIQKPQLETNKFLLTFGGIFMRKLTATLPTTSGAQRHIEIRVNLPTYFSFDSSTRGNSNVIGFATYRGDEVIFTSISPLPYQKLIYLESSAIFEVQICNDTGTLFQDSASNVIPNHVNYFTLTPIYD